METLPIAHPHGAGELSFRVYDEDGLLICEPHIKGRLKLPLVEWLGVFRETMAEVERRAKEAGCSEVRIAGRNWSRVFTDYEPLPGCRNGLRKRL